MRHVHDLNICRSGLAADGARVGDDRRHAAVVGALPAGQLQTDQSLRHGGAVHRHGAALQPGQRQVMNGVFTRDRAGEQRASAA